MEGEVFIIITSIRVATDDMIGVVRKQLGLSFIGETRDTESWVLADVRLKGVTLPKNVSASRLLVVPP